MEKGNEQEVEEPIPVMVDKMDTLYPILGGETTRPRTKKRKSSLLPNWVDKATTVSSQVEEDKSPLEDSILSDLDQEFVAQLREQGLTDWFPVQQTVIPYLLKDLRQPSLLPPRDICVSAPTGSGKTLCYVIPLIQALRRRLVSRIRALVMLPVQDLAVQVYNVFQTYTSGTDLKVVLLTGQKDFTQEKENLRRLSPVSGPDIIVATPGRLMDHILASGNPTDCPYLFLDSLRYLVVDEADRMMTNSRLDWLSAVQNAAFDSTNANPKGCAFMLPRQRLTFPSLRNLKKSNPPFQKIFLSATLSQDPSVLQQWNLFQPKLFAAVSTGKKKRRESKDKTDEEMEEQDDSITGHFVFPPELKQKYTIAEKENLKPLILHHILLEKESKWRRVLCFVGSKEKSHRLALLLSSINKQTKTGGGEVVECGAHINLARRKRIFRKFADGTIRVLICSDLVARGMDIDNVDCVINYTPPPFLGTYAHRVGRTARAGRHGVALSILTSQEFPKFERILKEVDAFDELKLLSISSEELKSLRPQYKEALQYLKVKIEEETVSRKGGAWKARKKISGKFKKKLVKKKLK